MRGGSDASRGLLLISPTLLYALLMLAAPLIMVLTFSFWTQNYLYIDTTFTFNNYRTEADGNREMPTTHYWMNSLQGVSENRDYFVSLNNRDRIPDQIVLRELEYEHPLFDREAIRAQARIPELNLAGLDTRTSFCGAWTRYGFHEDGLLSAVRLSELLLEGDPWENR